MNASCASLWRSAWEPKSAESYPPSHPNLRHRLQTNSGRLIVMFWLFRSLATPSVMNSRVTFSRSLVETISKVWLGPLPNIHKITPWDRWRTIWANTFSNSRFPHEAGWYVVAESQGEMDRNRGILIVFAQFFCPLVSSSSSAMATGRNNRAYIRKRMGKLTGSILAATVPAEPERGSARVSVEVHTRYPPETIRVRSPSDRNHSHHRS